VSVTAEGGEFIVPKRSVTDRTLPLLMAMRMSEREFFDALGGNSLIAQGVGDGLTWGSRNTLPAQDVVMTPKSTYSNSSSFDQRQYDNRQSTRVVNHYHGLRGHNVIPLRDVI
jgi:hypothetical protein